MIYHTDVSSCASPDSATDQMEDFGIFHVPPVDRKCPKPMICCIVEIKQLIFDLGWVQRAEITSTTIQEVFWVDVNGPTTMEYSWMVYFRDIAHGCWPP